MAAENPALPASCIVLDSCDLFHVLLIASILLLSFEAGKD
jgi:hypothetical protein